MRVKFISANNYEYLENQINDFFKNKPDLELITVEHLTKQGRQAMTAREMAETIYSVALYYKIT
ncbi:hypothetical protein ATL39_0917 [Sinobaca qinghaiensis]|uniref:Uncharacterized protein n=1 Tax=Sinobaca qinghaiensis TaxID=342944 RepID=A0A419V5J5_9BACL|nr:hypothetical protein [Sinobaca qinghaiensis]RKD75219.1 hypothetical protein ATL39_0917 [Sinobaca qinghaiensis]